MNKKLKTFLLLTLVIVMLAGCQAASTNAKKSDGLDLVTWFKENETTWRTVENGAWSKDPKDAPTDEELKQMFEIACNAQTAVGWTEFFFVAVRDPEEQKAIIGEEQWKGSTNAGTVTILILADQIADPENHKDEYDAAGLYMQTPMGYFDTGMACGLLNMAAYSMGYGTHYFASPAGASITPVDDTAFGFGDYPTPNYDLSRFLEGKNYTRSWGLMDKSFDVEGNVVMIGAVVIGKANPDFDVQTTVTKYGRPQNWAIWTADENTPPLSK